MINHFFVEMFMIVHFPNSAYDLWPLNLHMEVLTYQECRYICGLQTHNKLFEHGFPFWHDYMDWILLFHTQMMNEYIGVEHVIIYFESCETILIL